MNAIEFSSIDQIRFHCLSSVEQEFYDPANILKKPLTLILGGVCNDGVCLLADWKFMDSLGNTVEYDDNKIIGDQLHVVIGFSGSVVPFIEFRETMLKRVNERSENDIIHSANLIQKIGQQISATNAPYGNETDKFYALVARQYPNEKNSDLTYIDANGKYFPIGRYTAIGSARKFAIHVLNRMIKDEVRPSMIDFAAMSLFLIKYIESREIDNKVGLDNKKPLIYFLHHKDRIDRHPTDPEMNEINRKADEMLTRSMNNLTNLYY